MIASAVIEVATARTVPLICAAIFEGDIEVWDLRSQQKVGEFAALFAPGAKNLAVHPDGASVVTGVCASGSIASYKLPNGGLMWRRGRMTYPAWTRFDSSGRCVSWTVDRKRVERADASTGRTVEVREDSVDYIEGPLGLALTVPSTAPNYLLRSDHEISIPKLTFAILDVAFGSGCLCITESGGPVRCIDCLTGAERWRYVPPDGSHALRLHYSRPDGFFYGVVWQYQKGLFRHLARFGPETGQPVLVCNLKSWDEAFNEPTQQLVTSAGEVIELGTGKMVAELAFPRREYPDSYESFLKEEGFTE